MSPSLDFVSDQMTDGRQFKILTVIDNCTRECLALVADTSLSGARVARELDAIIARRSRGRLLCRDHAVRYGGVTQAIRPPANPGRFRALEEVGLGQFRRAFVGLEVAVGGRAAGVDDALRDPLVVEVEDFLAKDEVLQQHRPPGARLQLVLIVGDPDALVGGQVAFGRMRPLFRNALMGLVAWSRSVMKPSSMAASSYAAFRVEGQTRAERGGSELYPA